MTDAQRILIVDDDRQIRTMLRRYLTDEQFIVIEAADGNEMRAALGGDPVNLVLMDLTLPGEDGLSLARHIRQTSTIPIIMLTGKSDVIDRVAGLEAGADDYIAKPFHLREVLARIRTVMRRAQTPEPTMPPPPPTAIEIDATASQVLRFGGWRIDLTRRMVFTPAGEDAGLTSGEYDLLRIFVLNANRVLSRDQLMDMSKGRDWAPFDRAIDTQIGRLRRKIEADPGNPHFIKTVRGAGYTLAATVTTE